MGRARRTELRAEWAAQRIKGLSFFSAAKAAFFGNKGNKIKSLINEFHYPRFGPGQMWETMADEIIANGGEVRLNAPVTELEVRDGRIVALEAGGERIEPREVISSLPLRATVGLAGAAAAGEVQAAAQGLRYRDFLTVALVIDGEDLFPDNWIYIHDPSVAASAGSRTSAPGARGWSRTSPRPASAWSTSASRATTCGRSPTTSSSSWPSASSSSSASASAAKVERGFVTRVPKAYPMYDADYAERVDVDPRLAGDASRNLQQVGRNGLHRYNNSDHSMLTAMRAVENIIDGHRTTTSGRSTRSRSTTRSTRSREQPYKRASRDRSTMREPLRRLPRAA